MDSLADHHGWSKHIEETQGAAPDFPLIADAAREVANLWNMIQPNASDTLTVRSVSNIDPGKKIRLILACPAGSGRNVDAALRVIDSLQLSDGYKVATPVNWKQGEDGIIVPALKDEEARTLFPQGWKALKPYLRMVSQPKRG